MTSRNILLSLVFLLLLFFISSCGETESYPRPFGFHRIILPKQEYQTFNEAGCPFTFEYPVYAKAVPVKKDSCYYDIVFKDFNCRWYITTRVFDHKKVTPVRSFEDFRELVYKHTHKGQIYEKPVQTANGRGVIYELYGEVPTPMQFYFADSSNGAVLNSLYFNTAQRNDSLAPVINRLKTDMAQMIQTIKWK